MIIAGIDYSMTSPSICVFSEYEDKMFSFKNCKVYYLTDTEKYSGTFSNVVGKRFNSWNEQTGRFKSISEWAMEILEYVDYVAIEDYAFAAKGKVFHIAENTGVLKYKLHEKNIPVEVYAPTAVKKFATSKGNATKEEMYKEFCKITKTDLKVLLNSEQKHIGNPISDIVDSFFICQMLYRDIRIEQSY